jgi:Bifunctional DNA primase/polymerase, N-terminal
VTTMRSQLEQPIDLSPVLDAAVGLCRRDFHVVPLAGIIPGTDHCSCGAYPCGKGNRGAGKHPHGERAGYQDRPAPTESDLRRMLAQPNLNIGILTRGFVVIDVDEHDGKMSGSEALARLEDLYGPLPPTLISVTGTGGRHLIYRTPLGYEFGNRLPVVSAWLKNTTGTATGGVIDVRGKGGYIVVPPSLHRNGNLYRWLDAEAPLAELPLAWCETPAPLTLADPERRTHKGRTPPQRPKTAVPEGEIDPLDIAARERIADVDPTALLGRNTLERIRDERPDDKDRSHLVYQIILGAAAVRFDPERLYEVLLDSPRRGCLMDHGRAWFDANMLTAHRYLVDHLAVIADLRIERVVPGSYTFFGRNDRKQTIRAKSLGTVWSAMLDIAECQASTAPMVGIARQLPDLTGLDVKTCRKGLEAIDSLGWAAAEDVSDKMQSAYLYHLELGDPRPTGRAAPMKANRAVEIVRARERYREHTP